MKKWAPLIPLLIAVMLIAVQCGANSNQGGAGPAADKSSGPEITVMDPWARPSPVKAGNGAAYMQLMNKGGSDDVLLSAETDVAEVVELHETRMEGDVMKMSPLPNIPIPAGGSVSLKPGGMHIMLINLKQELTPGEKVRLTLNFEQSDPITLDVEIRTE